MKFKSHVGKRVYTGVREIVFTDEVVEVDDEKDIKALKGALDVEEYKGEKPKKDEKPE